MKVEIKAKVTIETDADKKVVTLNIGRLIDKLKVNADKDSSEVEKYKNEVIEMMTRAVHAGASKGEDDKEEN